ncbi:MAG: PUA domain-containing protein [Candidatus Bathyarchaeia archaeon]
MFQKIKPSSFRWYITGSLLKPSQKDESLLKIRSIADYQFGRGAGVSLFPKSVRIKLSPTTGKVRHVYLKGKLLATLRPTDGLFGLTVEGAKRLLKTFKSPRLRVVVAGDIEEFIRAGRSVFAKHVKVADPNIRPRDEVVVTNSRDEVLAVGRAVLAGCEMSLFRLGVAVKVRHGSHSNCEA